MSLRYVYTLTIDGPTDALLQIKPGDSVPITFFGKAFQARVLATTFECGLLRIVCEPDRGSYAPLKAEESRELLETPNRADDDAVLRSLGIAPLEKKP